VGPLSKVFLVVRGYESGCLVKDELALVEIAGGEESVTNFRANETDADGGFISGRFTEELVRYLEGIDSFSYPISRGIGC